MTAALLVTGPSYAAIAERAMTESLCGGLMTRQDLQVARLSIAFQALSGRDIAC